jgi:hypothetical protein
MSKESFQALIGDITGSIAGKVLDDALAADLNARYPAGGEVFDGLLAACRQAIEEGWMCDAEAGGIKYGRVIRDLDGFSVDVVQMNEVAGPRHRHPTGEINLIMPIQGAAEFDGHGAGWKVYGPDTAHRPTVSDGEALVLYLLPGGEIDFGR